MTSREKVLAIFNRKGTGEGAMWTGHPNEATVPIYAEAWHIEPTREAIFSCLNDDCRWLDADDGYQHPLGAARHRPRIRGGAAHPERARLLCRRRDRGGH